MKSVRLTWVNRRTIKNKNSNFPVQTTAKFKVASTRKMVKQMSANKRSSPSFILSRWKLTSWQLGWEHYKFHLFWSSVIFNNFWLLCRIVIGLIDLEKRTN